LPDCWVGLPGQVRHPPRKATHCTPRATSRLPCAGNPPRPSDAVSEPEGLARVRTSCDRHGGAPRRSVDAGITPARVRACSTWWVIRPKAPSSRRSPTPPNTGEPVRCDPRHQLVRIVDAFAAVVTEREHEGLGDFVGSSGTTMSGVDHNGEMTTGTAWNPSEVRIVVPGCPDIIDAPLMPHTECWLHDRIRSASNTLI